MQWKKNVSMKKICSIDLIFTNMKLLSVDSYSQVRLSTKYIQCSNTVSLFLKLALAFKAWTQSEFWIQMRTCWIFYDQFWLWMYAMLSFPHHLKRSKIGSLQVLSSPYYYVCSYFWCTTRKNPVRPFTNTYRKMYTYLLFYSIPTEDRWQLRKTFLMRNLLKISWAAAAEYFNLLFL